MVGSEDRLKVIWISDVWISDIFRTVTSSEDRLKVYVAPPLCHVPTPVPFSVKIHVSLIQTEAERRRREAGVKQSMEIRVRSCMWVGGWVGMYGIWNYLANQGT